MPELIIAIAVWCGSSVPYNHRSVKEVQTCRERLLKCLADDKKTHPKYNLKCFEKEKYE